MKLRKLLPVLAFAALSLVGCKKDNNLGTEPNQDPAEYGTTYMSFSFSNAANLRADGDKESEDYNYIGQWEGQDAFTSARLYIFPDLGNGGTDAPAQVVALTKLTAQANSTEYKATDAWKTTPGKKIVYAIVNLNNTTLKNALDAAANKGIVEFEKVYNQAEKIVVEDNVNTAAVLEDYAKVETNKDNIMITGERKEVNVEDNVTKEQAEGGKNQAHLYMRRLVARVLTTKGWTGDSYKKENDEKEALFTLNNIEWSYAQYEKTSYVLFQDVDGTHAYAPAAKVKSPNYDYVTTKDNYTKEMAGKYYAYNLVSGATPTYYALPELTRANSGTPSDADVAKITAKDMKFITETTHEYGATVDASKYRKGNTPYVIIRAQYVPGNSQMGLTEDGKTADTYTPGNDLYYGQIDGKFYGDYNLAVKNNSTSAPATDGDNVEGDGDGDAEVEQPAPAPEKQPVKDDNVITYTKGQVYYIAWVNPDSTNSKEWKNSPVVRNNIYHIHIKGFKGIGFSGNPFNPDPEDPNKPDPDEPTPNPEEPLPDSETYMHAVISVINWGVHSYDIEL